MEEIINAIVDVIGKAGYPGIFFFMMLEACCMPIPSEAILPTAGFLASAAGHNELSLPLAMLSAFAGALCGSTISYCVGRFGGRPLVLRFGRYIFLTPKRLAFTEGWFRRHGTKAVLVCRWISGMRAIISVPAGLCHMPYPRFLLYTALGSGAWVVVGTLFGFFVGKEWQKLSAVGHYLLIALIVVIAGFFVVHHFRSRHTEKNATEEPAE
jgi:membrane protein DedA with SNARE-associated domain